MNDREWDCNGQALWAFGMFDRISGPAFAFSQRVFHPYVVEAARWIRDNRSQFGLLKSGWSAEHLGDKDKPHYWDDLWGIAGLYEAGKMAERIGAPETAEIWSIYDDLRTATVNSILWVLDQQRRMGHWETFIPTGPANVGSLNSTIVGAVAYFHPCRLHIGNKMGGEVDRAARLTLDTIWFHFIRNGGFEHNSAWNAYGPYLTIQLAHAYLYTGQVDRMKVLIDWSVFRAAFARDNPGVGSAGKQIVLGGWNEQHCYPIASDFSEVPANSWYMGDIPHGWACGEFILLLRDMLFFEADEDRSPHVYLGAGLLPVWLQEGDSVTVTNAPTTFGQLFGFSIRHDAAARILEIRIMQALPSHINFIFPCNFGSGAEKVLIDGNTTTVNGRNVHLPGGFTNAKVFYKA